jgi:helicase
MSLSTLQEKLHPNLYSSIISERISQLRPCQEQSIDQGLLAGKNILICTPTASGKTLCAEMAMLNTLLTKGGKAIYLVPLKALASEKHKEFKRKYEQLGLKISLSIGNLDSKETRLKDSDIVITVAEKLDALFRHQVPWISEVQTVVVDEIHLLNDPHRGPTLEIIITLLRSIIKPQIVALSATIGNPGQLAAWLDAKLVVDDWRPVELKQGIHFEKTEFY